ncbi:MAG: hypothetical protein IKL16_00970 [Clostridia bacterium]|nr:hypothetical protein [Clostridia bacterium]
MKKFIALILALSIFLILPVSTSALSLDDGLDALKQEFVFGEGPEEDGYSIDYRYFSPVGKNDKTKYPLVVWTHGLSDGSKDGVQVNKSQIAYWASDEFQSRFGEAGGAFVLAARSREELGHTWTNAMVEPLRAAIEDFIAKNEANVDTTKIYIGGYSMGGKMTFKMAIAYPEMFAAIFPICPAWSPDAEAMEYISDMPTWLVAGKPDPLVNYHFSVNPSWKKLVAASDVPENLRFSTLSKVCYADGKKTPSAHHSWFAVNYDMFTTENTDYHYMSTVNGLGEEVKLTYPKGMISWLSSFSSEYDGKPVDGMGNLENISQTDSMTARITFVEFFEILFEMILSIFKF